MSWLNFANHFLSNQRLRVWSWINRTFSRMVFWWGIWLWVFGPFPFWLLFSAGRESRKRTGFWLAIKGKGPFQVLVFFLFLFSCDNSVLFRYCLVQRPFYIFCFLPIFDREFFFLFFALFQSWLGIFFLCFLPIFDRELSFFFCFLLRARMDILTLGQGLWKVGILAQGL